MIHPARQKTKRHAARFGTAVALLLAMQLMPLLRASAPAETWALGTRADAVGQLPPAKTVPVAVKDNDSKAALILKSCTFVSRWPAEKARPGTPLVIGIIGKDDGLAGLLREKVSGGLLGRKVVVKVLMAPKEIADCHALFVNRSELARQKEILREASRGHVLTFGDNESFEKDGGIITFSKENGDVRFTVNDRNRRDTDLKISSEIFELKNAKVTGRGR